MKMEIIKNGKIREIVVDGVSTSVFDDWYVSDFCVILQAVRNYSNLFIALDDDTVVVADDFKQDNIPADFGYSFEYLAAFFKQFGVELSFRGGVFEC